MVIVITVIHVLVSIGLILVVLLQTGKGAEVGAVFGGSSSTIFGSSGAGTFLTRLTTGMAIVFMITSLGLGYFAGRRSSSTIFNNRTSPVEQRGSNQTIPAPKTQEPAAKTAPAPAAPQSTESQKSKSQ
jgi:preprotein translocase subunit SecG